MFDRQIVTVDNFLEKSLTNICIFVLNIDIVIVIVKNLQMRQRFEAQLLAGQLHIEDFFLSSKSRISIDDLLRALHKLYCNKE